MGAGGEAFLFRDMLSSLWAEPGRDEGPAGEAIVGTADDTPDDEHMLFGEQELSVGEGVSLLLVLTPERFRAARSEVFICWAGVRGREEETGSGVRKLEGSSFLILCRSMPRLCGICPRRFFIVWGGYL